MWATKLTQRFIFFTGKGGTGKTSLSCAAALYLSSMGKKVLLVSTDPASNLDETLGISLGATPVPVPGAENLFAANLDTEEAASRYRERAVGPYRGLLPEASIRNMEEQLSGACTTEIAAFDEFTALLGADPEHLQYDHIVFDTAPTGHTLRLLSLPAAWSGFIDTSTSGVSCLGPLSALKQQDAMYRAAIAALKDTEQTVIVLVARPDRAAIKEAARASHELKTLQINGQRLIINGLFKATDCSDSIAVALEARGKTALSQMPAELAEMPCDTIVLLPQAVLGLRGIQRLLDPPNALGAIAACDTTDAPVATDTLDSLIDAIVAHGRGLVMTMGKGGVGKTTTAAEIAIQLAVRGNRVLLTTTDPAAHVQDAVGGAIAGLSIERIDPAAEVETYRQEVLSTAGKGMDAGGLAVLEEDLRSPCTEEIAVFRAFARAVERAADSFVVIDTAPTGHTILLLDAAEAYHREVLRTLPGAEMPEMVRQLLPRLRDPNWTHILIVTLPEPTPVHEASCLQQDLRRAGIEPYAWIVNQSLLAAGTTDPLLSARAHQEAAMIQEVAHLAGRFAVLPWRVG